MTNDGHSIGIYSTVSHQVSEATFAIAISVAIKQISTQSIGSNLQNQFDVRLVICVGISDIDYHVGALQNTNKLQKIIKYPLIH